MPSFPGYRLPPELALLRDQVRRFVREEIIHRMVIARSLFR
jgi:hypothetical protein